LRVAKRRIRRSNTSGDGTCAESFGEENNSRYEKRNHTWFCTLNRGFDVGLLLQRTGHNLDHDASNDCDYPGATADKPDNDDHDAPDGRRLLTADGGTA